MTHEIDIQATAFGDMNRALVALIEENKALRAALAAHARCECCGSALLRVEFGRAFCAAGCSYASA